MPAATISVFNYQNPRQFLLDRISAIQKENPSVSIRALARDMGLKSHSLLLLLLQGKRPLRVKHAQPLAKGLALSSPERLYLQALIQFDQAEDIEEKKLCSLWLSDLHPEGAVRIQQVEHFELVSNWIHMAILSLSETTDFDPSPETIAARLGKRATVVEVRAAIERLKTLGMIAFDANGRFHPTHHHTTTPDDIANRGVREYHRQVMELASEALESVPLPQREFQSFAVSIPHAKIALAKEMIRKFRAQFLKAIGLEPGEEVYQLNIQFFQLTESPERVTRSEDEGAATGWNNSTAKGETSC